MIYADVEEQVQHTLQDIQHDVDNFNETNFTLIHMMASLPYIKDPTVSLKDKDDQLYYIRNGNPTIIGLNITDLQGNSWTDHSLHNFSERQYFKNALQGKETIFGPIVNKVSNVATIFYGAPHYDAEGNLINTFFLASHGDNLTKICEQHKEIQGRLYPAIVRRSTGLVIATADPNDELQSNIFDDTADIGLKELSDMTQQIADGKTGVLKIVMPDGTVSINGFAPIADTDWSVILKADYSDFTASLLTLRLAFLVFTAIALALSITVSLIVTRKM